jgi:hypothetical protein
MWLGLGSLRWRWDMVRRALLETWYELVAVIDEFEKDEWAQSQVFRLIAPIESAHCSIKRSRTLDTTTRTTTTTTTTINKLKQYPNPIPNTTTTTMPPTPAPAPRFKNWDFIANLDAYYGRLTPAWNHYDCPGVERGAKVNFDVNSTYCHGCGQDRSASSLAGRILYEDNEKEKGKNTHCSVM